jgi:hypothetical protein
VRQSKEIIVLLALLIGAIGFVLWYVIDRRREMRQQADAPASERIVGPLRAPAYVPSGDANDAKAADSSKGQSEDTPEDRATRDMTSPPAPSTAPRRP